MGNENVPQLEDPPLTVKNYVCYDKLFEKVLCNVAVIWAIYDKKKEKNNCEYWSVASMWY